MPLHVRFLHRPAPPHLAHLRGQLQPDIVLTFGGLSGKVDDYDLLVAGRPEQKDIACSPRLRALIIPFAGLPGETRELMLGFPDIPVHNIHHNAQATAEMAVTLMLAAAKFIVPCDKALRQDDWRPRYAENPSLLLGGKTALILGYGAVGQRVSALCQGLGMRVRGVRRTVERRSAANVYAADSLRSVLPGADALIVTLPLTMETKGLIGEEELRLLPRTSILINIGRGPVVDEGALYRALRDGTIRAAGIDVWYSYPGDVAARASTPPSAHPFSALDNVVLSPHRAGSGGSREVEYLRMEHLARLINAAAAGESLPNLVDLQAGY